MTLHEAHVDAYWVDQDDALQALIDGPGAVAVADAVGRLDAAANAWRTGPTAWPYPPCDVADLVEAPEVADTPF